MNDIQDCTLRAPKSCLKTKQNCHISHAKTAKETHEDRGEGINFVNRNASQLSSSSPGMWKLRGANKFGESNVKEEGFGSSLSVESQLLLRIKADSERRRLRRRRRTTW